MDGAAKEAVAAGVLIADGMFCVGRPAGSVSCLLLFQLAMFLAVAAVASTAVRSVVYFILSEPSTARKIQEIKTNKTSLVNEWEVSSTE